MSVWRGGETGNLGDQLNFMLHIPELIVHCMNHTQLEFRAIMGAYHLAK